MVSGSKVILRALLVSSRRRGFGLSHGAEGGAQRLDKIKS